jgi:hypothetical protein
MTARCLRFIASASTSAAGVAKFGDDDPLVEDYRPVVVRSAHPTPRLTVGVESSKIDFLAIEPRELRLGRLVATW